MAEVSEEEKKKYEEHLNPSWWKAAISGANRGSNLIFGGIPDRVASYVAGKIKGEEPEDRFKAVKNAEDYYWENYPKTYGAGVGAGAIGGTAAGGAALKGITGLTGTTARIGENVAGYAARHPLISSAGVGAGMSGLGSQAESYKLDPKAAASGAAIGAVAGPVIEKAGIPVARWATDKALNTPLIRGASEYLKRKPYVDVDLGEGATEEGKEALRSALKKTVDIYKGKEDFGVRPQLTSDEAVRIAAAADSKASLRPELREAAGRVRNDARTVSESPKESFWNSEIAKRFYGDDVIDKMKRLESFDPAADYASQFGARRGGLSSGELLENVYTRDPSYATGKPLKNIGGLYDVGGDPTYIKDNSISHVLNLSMRDIANEISPKARDYLQKAFTKIHIPANDAKTGIDAIRTRPEIDIQHNKIYETIADLARNEDGNLGFRADRPEYTPRPTPPKFVNTPEKEKQYWQILQGERPEILEGSKGLSKEEIRTLTKNVSDLKSKGDFGEAINQLVYRVAGLGGGDIGRFTAASMGQAAKGIYSNLRTRGLRTNTLEDLNEKLGGKTIVTNDRLIGRPTVEKGTAKALPAAIGSSIALGNTPEAEAAQTPPETGNTSGNDAYTTLNKTAENPAPESPNREVPTGGGGIPVGRVASGSVSGTRGIRGAAQDTPSYSGRQWLDTENSPLKKLVAGLAGAFAGSQGINVGRIRAQYQSLKDITGDENKARALLGTKTGYDLIAKYELDRQEIEAKRAADEAKRSGESVFGNTSLQDRVSMLSDLMPKGTSQGALIAVASDPTAYKKAMEKGPQLGIVGEKLEESRAKEVAARQQNAVSSVESLNRVEDVVGDMLDKDGKLKPKYKGFADAGVRGTYNSLTRGFGTLSPNDYADYLNKIQYITSALSLESRQMLKGQGSISDMESRMLANASTLLANGRMSEAEFVKELKRIRDTAREAKNRITEDKYVSGYNPNGTPKFLSQEDYLREARER